MVRVPGAATEAALITMSVAEVLSPVIALSLVACNTSAEGASYAIVEATFVVCQLGLALVLGCSRAVAGFVGACLVLCGGMLLALLLSAPILQRVGDVQTLAPPEWAQRVLLKLNLKGTDSKAEPLLERPSSRKSARQSWRSAYMSVHAAQLMSAGHWGQMPESREMMARAAM